MKIFTYFGRKQIDYYAILFLVDVMEVERGEVRDG